MTRQGFLNSIKQGAIDGWKEHKILPSITGAQAVLESAWGESDLAKKANNLFGIKGDYQGYAYFKDSWEVIDGKNTTVRSAFRHYPDKATSVKDHGEFFTSTDWRKENYKNVIGGTDYKQVARALSESGYATDPDYPEKLVNIIEQYRLSEWDKEVVDEVVVKPQEEQRKDEPIVSTGKVVGIDIGHGSNTFPSRGKGVYRNGKGYAEHDFNSKLALALKAKLEASGVKVVFVQQPNSPEILLKTRTKRWNAMNLDLIVSIHANASNSSSANGRCAFYWHSSVNGKRLARSIINEIKKKGYSTHGNGLHASNYGSWTNLHMTRETKAVTVLVEHGFMTGNKDFNLIFGSQQAKYIEDMADADARGIVSYLGVSYGGNKAVAKPKPSKGVEDGKTLYRVQTGAFGAKANAQRLVNDLDAKGVDAIVTFDGKLYRVQAGAFGVKANAENQLNKIKGLGYSDAFITTADGHPVVSSRDDSDANEEIEKGDKVKIKSSARTYATGQTIPSKYKNKTYTVQDESADRVLIKELFSWVRKSDVDKV